MISKPIRICMGISQALRAKAAQICGVIERWAGLNIGLMATNFTRPCNKSFRYLEELIIEPNAYYLTICYFRSVPFWIARPSNLGAQRMACLKKRRLVLNMTEKTECIECSTLSGSSSYSPALTLYFLNGQFSVTRSLAARTSRVRCWPVWRTNFQQAL